VPRPPTPPSSRPTSPCAMGRWLTFVRYALTTSGVRGARPAMPPLSETTQAILRELLPAEAGFANPVDMLAAATAAQYAQYAQCIRAIADDPGVESVISIFFCPRSQRNLKKSLAHCRWLLTPSAFVGLIPRRRGVRSALAAETYPNGLGRRPPRGAWPTFHNTSTLMKTAGCSRRHHP
jgi:hypothetical protein